MRLYRAMIYVKDFPRMREFYSDMLGVKSINEKWVDQWAEFDTGSARFVQVGRGERQGGLYLLERPCHAL
ncbi:MAG TPA: hypothetical protein VLN48_12050 [Bryobacteraceae bacterium]|nr:hypothetical protein [Bryobacteraceae bacterium]